MRAGRPMVAGWMWGWLLALPALGLAQETAPAGPPARPGCFVGVMGHVARPGVYEYPHAPQLAEVIWYARGLTSSASNNIRVIREGHAGQKTFFSPQANFVLYPGDVVIAEGRRTPRSPQAPTPPDAAPGAPAGEPPLQIGCVNLLGRPVVLPVPREHATVERIAAYLGQSPQSVSRVIRAGAEQPIGGETARQLLPNGAVLVFDPSQVRIEQVPDLPNAFRIQPQGPPPPALEAYQRQTSANGPAMLPAPELPTAPPPYPNGPASTLPTATSAEPPSILGEAMPSPPRTVPQTLHDLESAFPAPATAEPAAAIAALPPTERPDASEPATAAPAPADVTDSGPGATAAGPETAAEPAPGFDWTLVVLAMGCLGAVVGTVWAWSRHRRERQSPHIIPFPETRRPAPETADRQRMGLLDALINDELPVSEEPCHVPAGLQFYGRPAGARRMRVEPAHAAVPGGPHFAARHTAAQADGPAETADEPERMTVSLRVDARDSSDDGSEQHPEDRRASLLDRVLTHIHQTTRPA